MPYIDEEDPGYLPDGDNPTATHGFDFRRVQEREDALAPVRVRSALAAQSH